MVGNLDDKQITVGTFPVPVVVIQVLDDVKDIKELSRMGRWNTLETALLERFEHPRWYGEPSEDRQLETVETDIKLPGGLWRRFYDELERTGQSPEMWIGESVVKHLEARCAKLQETGELQRKVETNRWIGWATRKVSPKAFGNAKRVRHAATELACLLGLDSQPS